MATAESCTGGLIAALLTEVPGSSDVVDCGFVTYSGYSKIAMLGVRAEIIDNCGMVSREVALAMAAGARARSHAGIAVSCTGVAGPGGGTEAKPVGLVHIAVERIGSPPMHLECRFGAVGRTEVRVNAVAAALGLVRSALA